MKDLASIRRRALALMREAIAMLDEAGEDRAAIHLQAAIDTAERKAPLKPGEEIADETSAVPPRTDLPADPALVRAMGGALAVIASVMARQGDVSLDEIANLLGIYAAATHETSANEGLIIACWGAILRDVAEAQRP
ncbi:hypothetical protein [Sphingomonas pituitosa]|nr:hypothetical protein [Sphingomonas pituitosa]